MGGASDTGEEKKKMWKVLEESDRVEGCELEFHMEAKKFRFKYVGHT